MRAGVFRGIEDVRVEEVAEPTAGPDGIVIEVSACGICGSDLHGYLHGSFIEPGQVMGHEFSGRVVEVGEQVSGISVGDRVTGPPLNACGSCARCAEGRSNLCVQSLAGAIAYGEPGAFAERLRMPASLLDRTVFRLPDGVSDEAGATAEPLAVAVHAVRLAPQVRGTTAVVLGLGMIGLEVLQVLRTDGVERVIGTDVVDRRLELAEELGFETFDGRDEGALAALLAAGVTVDTVFDCAGQAKLTAQTLDLVRPGGTVIVVGITGDAIPVDGTLLILKEICLHGSMGYNVRDFAHALDLLSNGSVQAEPLISHREPLDRLPEAFVRQLDRQEAIKVMIIPAASAAVQG